MSDFWVFGYGSLMWRPGFPFEEAVPARLPGLHRSLCIYSVHHRGTEEHPGLVLGLDRGGSCRGVAFRVAPGDKEEVLAYLREREQVTNVYLEAWRPITVLDSAVPAVPAVAYLVNRAHSQYAGVLPPERKLEIVQSASGLSGPNVEYVLATVQHLRQLGIHDAGLEKLAEKLAGNPSGSEGKGR